MREPTCWMCIQPFLSVVLIYLKCLRANSRAGCMFSYSLRLICSNTWGNESNSQTRWIIMSDFEVVKHWRATWTHFLDVFQPFLSVVLVWSNTTSELTTWTRMCVQPFLSVVLIFSNTHKLDADECSSTLISGSDLFKNWRVNSLAGSWMRDQSFSSA